MGRFETLFEEGSDGTFRPVATGVGETPEQGRIKDVKMEDGSIMLYNDLTGENQIIPADVKDQGASFELIQRTAGYINDVDTLLGVDPKDITKQIREPGFFETGVMAQILRNFGGTPARDREKLIVEIRARLGFEQIAEIMKDFSFKDAIKNVFGGIVDFFAAIPKFVEKGLRALGKAGNFIADKIFGEF